MVTLYGLAFNHCLLQCLKKVIWCRSVSRSMNYPSSMLHCLNLPFSRGITHHVLTYKLLQNKRKMKKEKQMNPSSVSFGKDCIQEMDLLSSLRLHFQNDVTFIQLIPSPWTALPLPKLWCGLNQRPTLPLDDSCIVKVIDAFLSCSLYCSWPPP